MKHTRIIAAALVLAGSLGVGGNAAAGDRSGWKLVRHHGIVVRRHVRRLQRGL